MKSCSTWQAQIFCGLREGYTDIRHDITEIYEICQKYIDEISWCVMVTPTKFVYKNGEEDGAVIGIIAYPRFVMSNDELENKTVNLAVKLKSELKQLRISIAFPDKTIMLEENDK